MLREERLDTIMALLRRENYLTVERLADTLHYSKATVRRDLAQLVTAGLAKRTFGGVALDGHTKPIMVREHEDVAEKTALCRMAAARICGGDTVFIGGSSTTRQFMRFLSDKKDITVVTTDLSMALALEALGIRVYAVGGKLKDGMSIGGFAMQTVRQMSFDMCFFSASGLSDDGELTVMSEEFGMLMRAVLERTAARVCLCTDEKRGRREFFSLGTLENIDVLVTSRPPEAAWKDRFPAVRYLTDGSQ